MPADAAFGLRGRFLMGPAGGWTLVFAADGLLLHCWMGALSFRNTVILTLLAALALVAAGPARRDLQALPLLETLALAVGAVWTARISNYRRVARVRVVARPFHRSRTCALGTKCANNARETRGEGERRVGTPSAQGPVSDD